MFKFTCFVFYITYAVCTQAESDSSESNELFDKFMPECMDEFNVKEEDFDGVVKSGDVTKIDPCYWGCYYTRMGLLNDKGQYDLNSFQTTMKKIMKDDEDYSSLEKIARKCESVKDEAVSDGEAGCKRGALLAACFLKNKGDII
ncbi:hypothetical protein PYW08_011730 [Mythimna loreyi]|uniref:Uncharacterized protein n=1 Tax=Mythimna loreyi TaxID=667449 RepID=A0ACC2QMU8_9NEOP|nr:hypothetical protein PYW08_011730 [Mythimna loreyi]